MNSPSISAAAARSRMQPVRAEPRQETIGAFVADRFALCVSEDCPLPAVLAMMGVAGVSAAAVIAADNLFAGLVYRSAVEGGIMAEPGTEADPLACRLKAGDIMIAPAAFLPAALERGEAVRVLEHSGHAVLPVLEDGGFFAGLATRDP